MTNITKKHFSREEKENLIALWKQSGKSKKAFSDERGLMYCTFVSWFEKYEKKFDDAFEEIKLPVVGSEKVFTEVSSGRTTIIFFQLKVASLSQKKLTVFG